MTDHPCKGLSEIQISAFESIAVNQYPCVPFPTINSLLKRGLIVQAGEKIVGRDRFGLVSIPQFEVPIHHHAQWCAWCDENVDEGDL